MAKPSPRWGPKRVWSSKQQVLSFSVSQLEPVVLRRTEGWDNVSLQVVERALDLESGRSNSESWLCHFRHLDSG